MYVSHAIWLLQQLPQNAKLEAWNEATHRLESVLSIVHDKSSHSVAFMPATAEQVRSVVVDPNTYIVLA